LTTFPVAPVYSDDEKKHRRELGEQAARIMRGKTNNIMTGTLTASAAASTFTDERIGWDSMIIAEPLTANAATELYGGSMYVTESGRVNGSVTFAHANNSQTDRNFRFLVVG